VALAQSNELKGLLRLLEAAAVRPARRRA
jgi:hypothetical protein